MNNDYELSEQNAKWLQVRLYTDSVPPRLRHLIPEYENPDDLLAWFEGAQGTLSQMAVRVEAERLGYLQRDDSAE